MVERGDILSEIRKRYSHMFIKIPRHIRGMHTELLAQRKLNRRLSEELIRSRETVNDLLQELEFVRQHDFDVSKQAQDAQNKLVSVLTQSDNTDEVLEEYHKLYSMQRDRLEESIRVSEQEKRIWIDAATSLALRMSVERGPAELVMLQKDEQTRLRMTTHIIVTVDDQNHNELNAVERQIDDWRGKLVKLSQHVVDDNRKNMERIINVILDIGKMQREMRMMVNNITANSPIDEQTAEHPMLSVFYIYDLKSIVEYLSTWVEEMTALVVRFTSEKDLTFLDEIYQIRKLSTSWIECGSKLLVRNEGTTNGRDYAPLGVQLANNTVEIETWLTKLEMRVSGDDGTATQIMTLQNQIDDKYNSFRYCSFYQVQKIQRNH